MVSEKLARHRAGLLSARFAISSLCAAVALAALFAQPVLAVPVNWGDFPAASVTYYDVTEDNVRIETPAIGPAVISSEPFVWGAPTTAGDQLLFAPVAFNVNAAGGSSDFLDGTLTTKVVADPGAYINQLLWQERGDYSLIGKGTVSTYVEVSAPMFVRIEAINGVGIVPIQFNANVVFTPSNGDFFLPLEAGVGKLWQGSLLVDLNDVIAKAGKVGKATQVTFSIDNILYAASEGGTIARMAKKQSEIILEVVPEPSSFVLAGLGLVALVARGRFRRR